MPAMMKVATATARHEILRSVAIHGDPASREPVAMNGDAMERCNATLKG
jgi:hypothetical protein